MVNHLHTLVSLLTSCIVKQSKSQLKKLHSQASCGASAPPRLFVLFSRPYLAQRSDCLPRVWRRLSFELRFAERGLVSDGSARFAICFVSHRRIRLFHRRDVTNELSSSRQPADLYRFEWTSVSLRRSSEAGFPRRRYPRWFSKDRAVDFLLCRQGFVVDSATELACFDPQRKQLPRFSRSSQGTRPRRQRPRLTPQLRSAPFDEVPALAGEDLRIGRLDDSHARTAIVRDYIQRDLPFDSAGNV